MPGTTARFVPVSVVTIWRPRATTLLGEHLLQAIGVAPDLIATRARSERG
jgi:hypothetical protein